MNHTADLVSEELYKLADMQKKFCRVLGRAKEDIFNIKVREQAEYSAIYKMLYDSQIEKDEYTKVHIAFNERRIEHMTPDQKLHAAKF